MFRSNTRSHRVNSAIRLLPVVLLTLCFSQPLHAQFRMILGLPDISEYARIKIPLQVLDNSAVISTLSDSNFTVRENGIIQQPLTLDCQTERVPDTIHFMFVMDVSLSMAFIEGTRQWDVLDSVKWRKAKRVITDAFSKVRPHDPAALLTFGETTRLESDFTEDKKLLADAVAGLRLRSGTAIYQAIIEAVNIAQSKPGKKVIILQTDGSDQTTDEPDPAIAAARAAGIPVYIIGLGVEPKDEATLRMIARSTGGEFFLAPTSEQLEDVFTRIISSILSQRCILSYVTSDTCEAGGVRNVEITVDIGGVTITESTSYTLPDLRSVQRLDIRLPQMIADDGEVVLPVMVRGEVRPGEKTNIQFLLTFDADAFKFLTIETTGSLLEGQIIGVEELAPGRYRITATGVIPARGVRPSAEDVLFNIRLYVQHQEKNRAVRFGISSPSISQNCLVLASGIETNTTVSGCPSRLHLVIDSTLAVESNSRFRVPILLLNAVDPLQDMRYTLRLLYDADLVSYQGFDVTASISRRMAVTVIEPVPGELLITGFPGKPADSLGVLLWLDFKATQQDFSHRVFFSISDPSIEQSCVPVTTATGDRIFLNGECRAIMTRGSGVRLKQNAPNPVTASTATIEFTVLGEGRTTLTVMDMSGRLIETLVDAELLPGTYQVRFSPVNLPGGSYLYTLTEGTTSVTKTMIYSK